MAACDSFGYPDIAPRLERALRAHAELFAEFARSSLKRMMDPCSGTHTGQAEKM